jgi:putative RecB family exonuclease
LPETPRLGKLAGKAWFGPDGLHLVPELNAQLARGYLSPSSASSYRSCPARFAIEKLLRRPVDPFGAAELGSAAHAALEELMGHEPALRTIGTAERIISEHLPVAAERVSAVVEVFARAHRLGARARAPEAALRVAGQVELHYIGRHDLVSRVEQVIAQLDGQPLKRGRIAQLASRIDGANEIVLPGAGDIGRWAEAVRERVSGLWQIEDPSQADVWSRELKIEQDLDGVPVLGYIDRVDRGNSGIPIVIDYKTGKVGRKDKHGDQLRIYSLAIAERTGIMPHRALAYYTAYGVAQEVNITRKAVNQTVDRFRSIWADMGESTASGVWPCKPSPLCSWCPLALVCPVARKAPPRSDVALIGPELGIGYGEALPRRPEEAGAAHMGGLAQSVGETKNKEEPTMSPATDLKFGPEAPPYHQTAEGTADLNPNSFSAIAIFGTVELALEALEGAGQRLTTSNVDALAQTFARLVADAQAALGARPSFQDGLNSRLRGALRASLGRSPVPFGQDAPAWEKWYTSTLRRMVSIAQAALRLWAYDLPEKPWAPLAAPQPTAPQSDGQRPQLSVVGA